MTTPQRPGPWLAFLGLDPESIAVLRATVYPALIGAACFVLIAGIAIMGGMLWPEWGGLLGLGVGTVVVWQGVRA